MLAWTGLLLLVVATLVLFIRPIFIGIMWVIGWTAWIWAKPFIINPKDPTQDLGRFLGLVELTENRIEVVQWGEGPSAQILYVTWQYGTTVPYCPAGLTLDHSPDPNTRSDFATTMLAEGTPRPDIVYDVGRGVLRDGLEVFRRHLRTINLDLVLFSFLAVRVRPYAVPFSKMVTEKKPWGTGDRMLPVMRPQVTDHIRINGDREIVTNSLPVKGDGVELQFVIRTFWFNNNVTALRFSTSPYESILDDAVNAAAREWCGARRLKDAFTTRMSDPRKTSKSSRAMAEELEGYVLEFLRTRPMVAIVRPDGTRETVSVADAFEWTVNSVRVSDILYASAADEMKGDEILSKPAAIRETGSANADAARMRNEADLDTVGAATPRAAEQVRRVALARAASKVTVFESGVDPTKGLLADIADREETK